MPLPHSNSPAATRKPKLEALTSIRGIAAWWVVLFHFDTYIQPYVPASIYRLISSGYLAVDLFFCLSGFVIFLNYGNLNVRSPRELKAFYISRFAKIYPLHLVTLGLYVMLVGAVLVTHRDVPEGRYSTSSLVQNLLLVQDWGFSSDLTWNIPSWSISAEFATYLLFPVIIMAINPFAKRPLLCLLLISALLAILNLYYVPLNYNLGSSIEALGVLRCATQFSIGAVLALLFLTAPFEHYLFRIGLLVAAALFLYVGLQTISSLMIPIAWALLVFGIALNDRNVPYLKQRWLVFIGEISYATYMIHYFIRDIFKFAFVHAGNVTPLYEVIAYLMAVLAFSIPVYLFVERPAQQYLNKRLIRRRQPSRDRSEVQLNAP